MAESLVLSDGTRSYDFFAVPIPDIYAQPDGLTLPIVAREDTWAAGSDSEGRSRIRSRALNPEGGFAVYFKGSNDAAFLDAVDNLQELVESAHRNKGTLTHTPNGGTAVTFDLEAISITGLPVSGVLLRQRHAEATVTFECKPYGRLAQVMLGTFTNLAVNGTFESNTTGWTTTSSTLTRVTDQFNSGVASGYIAVASSNNRGIVASSVVTVSVSTAYSASCYVIARSSADVGKQVKIRLEELTAASANVGQSEATVTLSSSWQRVSVSRLFGATGARAKVHVLNVTSAAMGWCVDDINLWAAEVLSGPTDYFEVSSVPGQVDAWGELIVKDLSAQNRNHIEVGYQANFNSSAVEATRLDLASGLTALGGSSNTRAGSVATNIIRAALATSPISICKAAAQPHRGLWKLRCRVYPSATTVRIRLAWRSGEGPFTKEKWVSVPNSAGWYDLDLGTVNIKELPSGHTCEFRVEGMSTSGSPTVDIDLLMPIPADNYTKLRGNSTPEVGSGALVAMDDFSTQTAGAVTGKTPLLVPAGTYAGAGDADDFQVDTANQWIYRSAVSDSALNNGRYLRAGSSALALTVISGEVYVPTLPTPSAATRFGLLLRYVDTSNWLMAVYVNVGGGTPLYQLVLIKRVAGTETVLATSGTLDINDSWRSLTVVADASGNVLVYDYQRGGGTGTGLSVAADSSLATAGALASGGYGFYDATTTSATTRYYDNLSVSTLATSATILNPAMWSGYGVELNHESAITDNSTGTATGTTPIREGRYLKIPPSTRNNTKGRIVVKARRDDVDNGQADAGTSDSLSAELLVTPRVHLVDG